MRAKRVVESIAVSVVNIALACQLAAASQSSADDIAVLKNELAHTNKGSAPEQWKKLAHQLCSTYARHADRAMEAEINEGVFLCLDEMMQVKPKSQSDKKGCQILAENQFNIIKLLEWRQSDGPLANKKMEIRAYGAAIDCLKITERPDLWGPAAYQIGVLFLETMQPERAVLAFEDALKVYTKKTNEIGWGRLRQGVGLALSNMPGGNRAEFIERAIEAYQDAASIITRENYFTDWLDLQNNIATVFLQRIHGDRATNIEEGIQRLDAMWSLHDAGITSGRRLQIAINLSNAFQERLRGDRAENIDRAIAILAEALRLPNVSNLDLNFAKVALGTAYLHRLRSDRDDNREAAIKLYREVINSLSPNHALRATAEMNLGLALAQLNRGDPVANTRSAIDALTEALHFARDSRQKSEWALAQLNLGSLWGRRRDGSPSENQARSIAAYQAALTVFTAADDPQRWALAKSGLSAVLWRSGSPGNSANADAAIAAGKAAFSVLSAERYPRDHMLFSLGLAQRILTRGDIRAAGQLLDAAASDADRLIGAGLDEAETRDVLETVEGVFSLQALLAARHGDAAGALAALNRGRTRLLRSSLRLEAAKLSASDHAELTSLRAAIRIKERLVEIAATEPVTSVREGDLDALAALRAKASSLLARESLNDPTSDAMRELKAHQVLLAPLFTPFGSTLLIAEPGDIVRSIPLPDGLKALLDREAAAWIANYRKGDFALSVSGLNQDGGSALGSAVQQALTRAGIADGSDLVILVDGKTSMLPWLIAADGTTGRMLIDRFQASFIPSLEVFVASSRRSQTATAKTLGILSNPAQDPDLLAAPAETAIVGAIFGQRRSIVLSPAEAALPASVLASLKNQNYWHILAHASFNWDTPRDSGIQLARGQKLTIASMLESGITLSTPRLAVLSACETGISDTEHNADEFMGLPSALMEAGLAAVVGSLWPVQDLPTMLIMGHFYENHITKAQSPALALRNAQLWLRDASRQDVEAYLISRMTAGMISQTQLTKVSQEISTMYAGEHPFADPVNWGGFVLYGE